MATYVEKKREAIGLELPPADPFAKGSIFDVPMTMGRMSGSGHITNFDKQLKEQIDEQTKLKTTLEIMWDAEYVTDQKTARKNLGKLCEYLSVGDDVKTEQFFAQKPAADWLNRVFLDEAEINKLTDLIKKSSPKCRVAVAVVIRKELERLINFKILLEQILEETL